MSAQGAPPAPKVRAVVGLLIAFGHSLLAMSVVARLQHAIGVEVPVRLLFESPSLAEFAGRVEQLLRSFDQPFPSNRRAYAMMRCLVDLGLRSSEVVGLRLDDIDWRAGMVRLAKPKSRRTDVLPLPRCSRPS